MLEVSKLCKSYGTHTVLKNVSFVIPSGSCVCLWGANGSGKTTLLRMLTLLEKPSSGAIFYDGENIRENAALVRARMGVLGHKSMLYPNLSARENLMFYAQLYGIDCPDKRVDYLLEKARLTLWQHEPAKTLSRGMTQRLSFARACVHDPDLLFLDEPYTGLDVTSAAELDEALDAFMNSANASGKGRNAGGKGRNAGGKGRTVVMVTHDEHVLARHATHVITFDTKRKSATLSEYPAPAEGGVHLEGAAHPECGTHPEGAAHSEGGTHQEPAAPAEGGAHDDR
jgi:heme exporter protein A